MYKNLCAYAYFVEAIKSLNSLKTVPTIGYILDIYLFVWSVWSEPDILGSMYKNLCAYAYFVEVSEQCRVAILKRVKTTLARLRRVV